MTTRLALGNEKQFIHLEVTEILPDKLPCAGDIAFAIEILSTGFSGCDETVWFGRPELERFLADLKSLDKTHQGSAILTDLSYGSEDDGFCLKLFDLDRHGHFGIKVDVQKPVHLGSKEKLALKASVCFEIEPSDLAQFLRGWQDLLQD